MSASKKKDDVWLVCRYGVHQCLLGVEMSHSSNKANKVNKEQGKKQEARSTKEKAVVSIEFFCP